MNAPASTQSIDWSRFRLTRFRVKVICAIMVSIAVGVSAMQFIQAEDYILPAGTSIGGDYVAFFSAARAAQDGDAAAIYDADTFEQKLHEYGPPKERFGLTWQYPPTYFFIIAPLAILGFIPGYVMWTGGTFLAFFATMRAAGSSWLFLFVLLAAPSTFHAVITGQNGFLTATLIAVATLYPDKRPIIAGLAAALLTVKPQLGLLLPLAYLAGGCWRAFFTAALGAMALAVASAMTFGPDVWQAFIEGASATSDRLAQGVMPLYKMTAPFSAALYAGLPAPFAGAFYALSASAAAIGVGLVWRRLRDSELRAAMLAACVFFAAPYAFYYELVILALPVAILAKRAMESGWLRYEQIALTLVIALPLFLPGGAHKIGFSLGLTVNAILVACLVRRVAHEHPHVFRFASLASRL